MNPFCAHIDSTSEMMLVCDGGVTGKNEREGKTQEERERDRRTQTS